MKILYAIVFILLLAGCDYFEDTDAGSETAKKEVKQKKRKKLTGLRTSYYDEEEKMVMAEVEYVDGVRNGTAVDYYKNGKVRLRGAHVNGVKEGVFEFFHEDGTLYRKLEYKQNKKYGWDSTFYKSGRVKSVVPYEYNVVLEGTKEWNRRYQKVPMPKIKLREVSRVDTKRMYYLFASFQKSSIKNTKFYIGVVGNGTPETPQTPFEPMFLMDDKTEFVYSIPLEPGYEIVAKLVIRAEGKTKRGNPYRISKVFPVVLR